MALLDQPNHETATGRSFFAKKAEFSIAIPLFLDELVVAQSVLALDALGALAKYKREQDIRETAALTNLVSEKRLGKVHTRSQDYGSVWRRSTDGVSHNIALVVPNTRLISGIFGDGDYYTDETKICLAVADEGDFAFYSLLTQAEYNRGMQLATDEMKERLMTAVIGTL